MSIEPELLLKWRKHLEELRPMPLEDAIAIAHAISLAEAFAQEKAVEFYEEEVRARLVEQSLIGDYPGCWMAGRNNLVDKLEERRDELMVAVFGSTNPTM